MNKNKKRKLRKVTHCPRWLLKINGKCDAKKGGKKAVDMKIHEWIQRLGTFENDVYTEEEAKMFPLRTEAAQAINILMSSAKNSVNKSGSITVDPKDPKSIRAARRERSYSANQANTTSNNISNSTKDIIRFNEAIISSNVDVAEHIDRLRNHCNMCISRYISGVLKVIPDYSFDEKLIKSNAKEISQREHYELDEEIKRIAYRIMKPEEKQKEAV